tara:strand:+ start:409 stop:699 length:291 start_codon:yes stop_codon:yes gene_type:complete
MKRDNTNIIGDIVRKLMRNPKLAKKLDELDALNICKEVIGEKLNKYINDIIISNGKLIIKLKSAVLRNELSYQKTNIITKVNNKLGKEIIKEIILK